MKNRSLHQLMVRAAIKLGSELSIIGANSVVTVNISARAIAVGSPARLNNEWDEERGIWRTCCNGDDSWVGER